MSIFISSDFHYGHTNICGPKVSSWDSGYRDFNSVYEMNRAIVDSVNSNVKSSDILYFLGDWAFGGKDNIRKLREQLLVENIIFVKGNHDKHIDEYKNLFTEIVDYKEVYIANKLFCMSHYPFSIWNKKHRGSLMLCGHSHGSFYPSTLKCLDQGKILDVGWCSFRKVLSVEEILEIMSKKSDKSLDHHK